MTDEKDKKTLEPPMGLDMSFDEALQRFTQTDPKEVEQSIERSKKKKPPGNKKRKSPGSKIQPENVIDLGKRRARKRNTGR